MSQATEEARLSHYCFNFTDWVLGPEVKMLSPTDLTFMTLNLFLEMGSGQAEERPRVWAVPTGGACGRHQ